MGRMGTVTGWSALFLLVVAGGCAGEAADLPAGDLSGSPTEKPPAPEAPWRLEAPIYTVPQAEHGAEIFGSVCATCHSLDDFTSTLFQREWAGGSVGNLYGFVRTAMPQNNPGGLDPEEYAAVVSFIFRQNGLPAGETELGTDEDELRGLRLELAGDS